MATFPSTNDNFKPSLSSSRDTETKVLRADFGDGFTQRAADGINNKVNEYNLIWRNIPMEDAQDIVDFLEARGGWESFDWLDIFQELPTTIKVVAEQWSRTPTSENLDTISATFRQVFDL